MGTRVDNIITERQVKGWDTLPTYVSVIKFNVPKIWLRFEIRHNKDDEYEPFDNIKKGLLKVVKERMDEGNSVKDMWRYEFANLVLDLYTKAITECDWDAFKVEYFEAKDQLSKYIDKNKKKIETLERVKWENSELDKQIQIELNNREKKKQESIEETKKEIVQDKKEIGAKLTKEKEKEKEKEKGKTKTKVKTNTNSKEEGNKNVVNPLDILPTSSRMSGLPKR